MLANARLSYRYPLQALGSEGELVSTLSYTYRGDYYNRVFNSERDLVPAYHLAHLNFRYLPDGASWELELNIQNLFDEDEIASVHTDDFFQGVTSFQLLPPRLVTLGASYRF
jgi:iron complex outermembrane receptor protein